MQKKRRKEPSHKDAEERSEEPEEEVDGSMESLTHRRTVIPALAGAKRTKCAQVRISEMKVKDKAWGLKDKDETKRCKKPVAACVRAKETDTAQVAD